MVIARQPFCLKWISVTKVSKYGKSEYSRALNASYMFQLIYSSMALDGGLIKEANNFSQWFFSLHYVASGLEKPLLAGIFGLLSSSAPTPLRRCCAARPYYQWRTDHRPTSLSSFALAFKKRSLYLVIGICGTWMHRFAFWKFYL